MKKESKKYFIKKQVFANSIQDALKKEKKACILEIYEEIPPKVENINPVGFQ